MTSRILTIPLIAIAFVLSLFVLPVVDSPFLGSNLFTVLVILVLLYGDTRLSVVAGFIGGICLDLYSPYPYGASILAYLITFVIIRRLYVTRLTNRSLLSYLTLASAGTVIVHLASFAYRYGMSFIDAQALRVQLTSATSVLIAGDMIRTVLLALVIYALVRASGRSYATLTSHDF